VGGLVAVEVIMAMSNYNPVRILKSSSSFIRSVNIKQSYTAMQYSGAGQQGPRKDTDSCPKKKHE